MGTESLAPGVAVHSVPVVGFSIVVAVHLSPECLGYFVGFVLVVSILVLLYIFTDGAIWALSTFLCLGAVAALGLASSWGCGSIFMGGI